MRILAKDLTEDQRELFRAAFYELLPYDDNPYHEDPHSFEEPWFNARKYLFDADDEMIHYVHGEKEIEFDIYLCGDSFEKMARNYYDLLRKFNFLDDDSIQNSTFLHKKQRVVVGGILKKLKRKSLI